MNDKGVLMGLALSFMVGALFLGIIIGKQEIRVSAIRHGAAHWVVNDSGETKFEWGKQ